jgi:hypothetical protein
VGSEQKCEPEVVSGLGAKLASNDTDYLRVSPQQQQVLRVLFAPRSLFAFLSYVISISVMEATFAQKI